MDERTNRALSIGSPVRAFVESFWISENGVRVMCSTSLVAVEFISTRIWTATNAAAANEFAGCPPGSQINQQAEAANRVGTGTGVSWPSVIAASTCSANALISRPSSARRVT